MSEQVTRPEEMAEFFDARAGGYDEHMERTVTSFREFYSQVVVRPIEGTTRPVRVLDLGAGTGLELEGLFAKAPNAQVTAVDLSAAMLSRLQQKYVQRRHQITVMRGSYLDLPLGESVYDYAISVMTMHHLLPEVKVGLYRKILRALRPGGVYVEGDYVVSEEKACRCLDEYRELVRKLDDPEGLNEGRYHLDIPFTVETQVGLMQEAGFCPVELIWHEGEAAVIAAVCPEQGRPS